MAAQVSRCELQRLHAALDCSGALVVSPSCRAPRWSTALATACQKDAALAPAFRGHVGTPSASRSGLSSHCWKAASIAGAPCRPGPQVLAPDCLCQVSPDTPCLRPFAGGLSPLARRIAPSRPNDEPLLSLQAQPSRTRVWPCT
nr:uncharacterized protein LOC131279947 isoform X3 [Dasypus novemcinctus]